MAATQNTEDTHIDAAIRFLKKWGTILTLCGGAGGILWKHWQQTQVHEAKLERLREDFAAHLSESLDLHRVGDRGFVDPKTRLALDEHIRGILKDLGVETRADAVQWRRMLFDLNPTIRKPTE
jgi:hypothetical protein